MNVESPPFDRRLARLMLCAAGLLCLAFGIRMVAAWKTYHHVDPTAGVWTAAALDAREGILYRPIESEIGYGGSRYAPLHIVLQAALMRMGMGPVAGGYLLDLIGILGVIGGVYALLRQLEIAALPAAAFAGFVLAAYCYSTTAAGLKGDLLPAGLNLWGLAAVAATQRHNTKEACKNKGAEDPHPNPPPEYRERGKILLVAAAICFVLAMATKLTSIFGIAAAALWLIGRKDWRNAVLLGAVWLIGIAAAAMATQWASDDRAYGIFKLCAAGGGGLSQLLNGPHRMVSDAIHNDRVFVCFWLLAAGLIVIGRQWTSLPAILFAVTTLGTAAIYGSPGTNCNHLVDLQAAAVVVIATGLWSCRAWGRYAALAATAIVLIWAVASGFKTVSILRENRRGTMMSALADADRSRATGPLLSENPILPILQGRRPYMLDSFMFRAVRMRDPQIADRFWDDLSRRNFRAVILSGPPWDATRSGNAGDFGPGFIDLLQRNYELIGHHGEYWVYLPKQP
ncbi:MAG: hypothetical protein ABSB42_08525 [Tepidisphaeraceae bacterium]